MTGALTKRSSVLAIGVLAAMLLLPAAVTHADEKDAEFANLLATHGIHLGTPSQTGNMARSMCQDLDAGYTQSDEVNQLTEHHVSQAQAEFFVGAATAEYCPEHHSPSRPSG